ncbi:MAG: squalene synthase HpnC [Armatimonadetes bacterium]|nr:squalene synthase HpnC [Armatimonadota bacterium]MDE2207655.1 squalene synthase HpnC [Armatimonadota bacterium]
MTAVALLPKYQFDGSATLAEAEAWCARLARSHYENFIVGSLFCPRPLRHHFYNYYAFCRVSDDLADEAADSQQAALMLDAWESELERMERGEAEHPVFVALRSTTAEFGIPTSLYHDLLRAFRQDQSVQRYPTFHDLLGYCRYSANPVGRVVLHLAGYRDEERLLLSDSICTALQLANFWQDVGRDYARGRIYIPLEDIARFGYTEAELARGEETEAFRNLMAFEAQRTRELFQLGAPLAGMVHRRLRLDVEMFSQGGAEVLRLIERQEGRVLSKRPAVSRGRQAVMLIGRLIAGLTP